MLHRFWHTESIAVLEDNCDNATPTFLNQMHSKEELYKVSLPWKEGHFKIPEHYVMCVSRLRYLQHKLIEVPRSFKPILYETS